MPEFHPGNVAQTPLPLPELKIVRALPPELASKWTPSTTSENGKPYRYRVRLELSREATKAEADALNSTGDLTVHDRELWIDSSRIEEVAEFKDQFSRLVRDAERTGAAEDARRERDEGERSSYRAVEIARLERLAGEIKFD